MVFLPILKKDSHKGENGKVLIIGGGKTYHGAPILAVLAAKNFCDLVYFSTTKENIEIFRKMKISTPNVICIEPKKITEYLKKVDCILFGNGLDINKKNQSILSKILKTKKKCVLDAAGIRMAKKQDLHSQVILTPHKKEYEALFNQKPTIENLKENSKNCTILLKGKEDWIGSFGKSSKVKGGSAAMTKGGTGDVLAGLVCALYSQCDSPFLAAYSASFLNKKAGESLYKVFGYYYSSEDLAREIPHTAAILLFSKKPHLTKQKFKIDK